MHSYPASRRILTVIGTTVVAMSLVITVGRLAFADTTVFADDFSDGNANGWSKAGGSWSVVTDGSPVLHQANATTGEARAYAGPSSLTDLVVQARVKATSVGSDGFVALAARQQSSTNTYRLALYSNGQAQLQAVKGATITVLGTGSSAVPVGTWATVRVEVAGTRLRGYVNGALVASGTSTMYANGKIGVATYHSSASFDDVVATTAAGPAPSPSLSSASPSTAPSGGGGGGGGGGTPPAGEVGYATLAGGTTGGAGGPTVTVSTWSELTTEAGKKTPEIIQVNGMIQGSGQVTVRNDKTIVGIGANSGVTGGGFKVSHYNNVIFRNLKISYPVGTDAIGVQNAQHIWIDHNELWSDRAHNIDYYDGLIDITHATDYVTVSWNKVHDHWKTSLVGHDDGNASEDTGHLTVTYHHNEFYNDDARLPSIRFGTAHIFNNYYHDDVNAVHSRMGAQVLVEGNQFTNVTTPIKTTTLSVTDGYAVERGNAYTACGPLNITQVGTFTNPPYAYTLDPASSVASIVSANAGTGHV